MPFLPYTTGCLYGALLNFVSSASFVIVAFPDLDKDVCVLSMGFGFSMLYLLVSQGVASSINRRKHSERISVFLTHEPLSRVYMFKTIPFITFCHMQCLSGYRHTLFLLLFVSYGVYLFMLHEP